ncbi:MAG: tetratricopeptide repeat protein [Pseudomonas profundi]|uniref:tetratricopeptide repeat protein n=1 Tax=Pseudomonas profundi TaxID=1981513 RepID=UPI003002101E
MKAFYTYPLLVTAFGLWLSGCAATGNSPQPSPQPIAPEEAISQQPEPEPPIVYGQFSQDTLFALLSAEIAGQRNRFDVALNNYLEQARITRDPGIIQRAMQVAEFLGAQQPALEMALLWVEVKPEDPEALRAAALQQARAGDHERAMAMMEKVLALHGETHFDFLALAAAQTDSATRQAALESLQQLQQKNPQNAQLVFATALLLQQEDRQAEALALLEKNPAAHTASAPVMLHARLLAEQGETQKAISTLQDGLISFPDDTRMRLLLAGLLVANDDLEAAAAQFALLVEQNPNDAELLLALGLVNLESGDPGTAIEYLERLTDIAPGNNTGLYHLGLAYQESGRQEDALRTWQSIDDGNEFLTSRLQISRVLIERDNPDRLAVTLAADRLAYPDHQLQLYLIEIEALFDEHPQRALDRINEALQEFEAHTNLLYMRAMASEKLGDPAGLERDLRAILEREPDNAMALNALGYTLADRNERLDEALELIERAHRLEPDDAAIADSLGWVHYRLGNLDKAEELLRQAYREFPDQEVAAHLGEVLWKQGRKAEARAVWNEAVGNEAEGELIRSTRERLGAR